MKTEELKMTDFLIGFNRILLHSDINHAKDRHSRESGNPGKYWIPGQARNDRTDRTYVVVYNSCI